MQTLGLSDSTPKPTSRLKELFWPNLTTEPNAQSACQTASLACFAVGGLTAIVGLFMNKLGLVDASLFLLIGLGLRKMWRTAALAGLLLYLLEQAYNIAYGNYPGILVILIAAIMLNGVRASFAYQRMRRHSAAISPPPSP